MISIKIQRNTLLNERGGLMRIIDLLNKIAKGEEVPKKIKWRDCIWEYDNFNQDYTHEELMLFEQFKSIRTKEFLNLCNIKTIIYLV